MARRGRHDSLVARRRVTVRAPRVSESARAHHVDHIHPVLFGGTDDPANLQALCAACNLAKGPNPPAAA